MTEKAKDIAMVVNHNDDGSVNILRRDSDDNISYGTAQAVKDGQNLTGSKEVISMSEPDDNGISNVKTLYKPQGVRSTSGPAQVATKAYRDGWDGIFGSKTIGDA